MPRRAPKHAIKPGQVLNPNGRPVGAGNKVVISEKVREAFAKLLEGAAPHLEEWLIATAKKNPDKALDIFTRISERFVPSLSRTELVGKDGEAFAPITINMPMFNLPKPDSPQSLGEPSSIPLPVPPGAETKAIGEGTPTEDRPGHYEHSQSAVSKEDGHYEHSDSAVSEPHSSEPAGEPSPDVDSFTFLPDLGKVSAPPGWKRD
jgi:hypothetical protein